LDGIRLDQVAHECRAALKLFAQLHELFAACVKALLLRVKLCAWLLRLRLAPRLSEGRILRGNLRLAGVEIDLHREELRVALRLLLLCTRQLGLPADKLVAELIKLLP
jgi:hypothetical protein